VPALLRPRGDMADSPPDLKEAGAGTAGTAGRMEANLRDGRQSQTRLNLKLAST
jgi:hypothetical protein